MILALNTPIVSIDAPVSLMKKLHLYEQSRWIIALVLMLEILMNHNT